MCGITAYIGHREAMPVILKGLKALEYRGYDSAGLTIQKNGKLTTVKALGNTDKLNEAVAEQNADIIANLNGTAGIGHTRWATHGVPSVINAHPHLSADGKISLVHNGQIENYRALKKLLERKGYTFKSDTDTEVLPLLITDIMKENPSFSLTDAVRAALHEIVGAYAIVVLHADYPNLLVAARMSSPVVIGLTMDYKEYIVASSEGPIIGYSEKVINLDDGQIATIILDELPKITDLEQREITPYLSEITMTLEQIEKGGFDHFMLKEIHEQTRSLEDTMRGRIRQKSSKIVLGGIQDDFKKFLNAKRFVLLGCGTSYHAAMVGKYLLEDFAKVATVVETASEFRYRNPIIHEDDVIIGVSQSGQTADTNGALITAKPKVRDVFGICNVVGSELSRLTTAGCYTHAGVEIGVASTKAFTAQVSVFAMMALSIGHKKGLITKKEMQEHVAAMLGLPQQVKMLLDKTEEIKAIAKQYLHCPNFLYMGRGYGYPVALEGALKLKEISYIHAEGLCAAEIKHGIIALIDENMPTVVIATKESDTYDKVLNAMSQIKSRKGKIIALCTEGDEVVREVADHVIELPKTKDYLYAITASIPLQLLAYHTANLLGKNVDQPRGLAKAVTVE